MAVWEAGDGWPLLPLAGNELMSASNSDWRGFTVPLPPSEIELLVVVKLGTVRMKSPVVIARSDAAVPNAVKPYILNGQSRTSPVWRFLPWLKASVLIRVLLTPLFNNSCSMPFMKGGGPHI